MTDDIIRILMANTIGESVLIETLRSAAYFITRSTQGFEPRHHVTKSFLNESRHCYYFVQGTGLDLLIQRFRLDYDPTELRNTFNYFLKSTS